MATTGDIRDLRGALEAVVARVAPDSRLELVARALPGMAKGVSAEIRLDDEAAGRLGSVAQEVLDYYGLECRVAAAEIRFDALVNRAGASRTYKPLPKFPAVRRDLSVIVDADVNWQQLYQTIASVDQPARADVQYVTTYRGRPIAQGRKSVTLTLVYRSPSGTLRSEQVEQQVDQVLTVLKQKLGAELRK